MPHSELGTIAFDLGGGGCIEGLPQAVQIREFCNAGIWPDRIFARSVGVFNGWNLPHAVDIWQNNFSSPWDIYDLHPDLKKYLDRTLRSIPTPLLRKHKNWLEAWRDWSNYKKKYKSSKELFTDLSHIVGYIRQVLASLPALPMGSDPSTKDIAPLLEVFISDLKALGLNSLPSFLDPSPLIATLQKVVNLNEVLEREASFHIFARSRDEHYIFSCGKPFSAESMGKLSFKYKLNEMSSEEDIVSASLASTAIRPFFPPVTINGRHFRDSGTVNPFPVECAMDAGCDTIFSFVKNYWAYNHADELNALESIPEEADMSASTIFSQQYDKAKERAEREGKRLHIIYPAPLHKDLQLLWISPEAIEYTIRVERDATRKWIKDNLNIEY